MKAIYAGSFNPWHAGHSDVLKKAMHTFPEIIVAIGQNPMKPVFQDHSQETWTAILKDIGLNNAHRVEIKEFSGLLVDFIDSLLKDGEYIVANIRGLRHEGDFREEMIQMYHNEDLGIRVPTVFYGSDRGLVHFSSSAVKMIEKLKGERK